MSEIGRHLLILGGLIALVGAALLLGERLGLGRLPGDFLYKSESEGSKITIGLPLATSLILSIVATIVLNLLFGRR